MKQITSKSRKTFEALEFTRRGIKLLNSRIRGVSEKNIPLWSIPIMNFISIQWWHFGNRNEMTEIWRGKGDGDFDLTLAGYLRNQRNIDIWILLSEIKSMVGRRKSKKRVYCRWSFSIHLAMALIRSKCFSRSRLWSYSYGINKGEVQG